MVEIAIAAGLLPIFAIAGVIADYILLHIKPLNKWIDSLPLAQVKDAEYEVVEETEESKQVTNSS